MMPDAGSAPPERLLVVVVGLRRFGLPLREVRGIQARGSAGATAAYRSGLIPVLEPRALGLAAEAPAAGRPAGQLVIVGAEGGEMALAVDGVEGLVDAGEVRALPELVAPFVRGVFRGIVLRPAGELLVVDTGALVSAAAAFLGGREAGEA